MLTHSSQRLDVGQRVGVVRSRVPVEFRLHGLGLGLRLGFRVEFRHCKVSGLSFGLNG